jgi:SNF2 family DNA or RNA helicase
MTIKPFAHQLVSLKHNEKTPIVFDTSDAGTGKTYVRIARFAKRRAKGGKCMLVVCPRSTMRSVWLADFRKFAPHLKVVAADAANREKAFAEPADVYIVNHDASKWLAKKKKPFFDRFDEVAIDESPAFKHHTSDRSESMLKIIKYFKYRTLMTATPNSNTIVDVFHQALLLDDGRRLGKLFFPFRTTVCTPVQNMKKDGTPGRGLKWIDKEGAEDAVFNLLSDIVIRHKLDDCADIPENFQYPLMYSMSKVQQRAYEEMQETQLIKLGKEGITAINASAVATKLMQVSSGAVYSSPGTYHVIDTGRYELILDLVQARVHPLVLFQWKHQCDMLVAEAEKRELNFAVFDGSTSDNDRARIVAEYQGGQLDVLFAHPKTVGHGQTLTRGKSTIWASPTHDLELFIQASSRQRRLGQTEKTETIVILGEGTVDEWAYENVMNKDGKLKSLLDLFSTLAAEVEAKPKKRRARVTA